MTSELFTKIEQRIAPLDGWCTVERACELAAFVVAVKPKLSVVLGIWGGRDLFALAMAHEHNGFGKVLGCDPWQASRSVLGQTGQNEQWWSDQQKHDLVHDRFVGNLHALSLAPWADIRKQPSSEVEPPEEIGAISIDANHGPESILDVERWAPKVVMGGLVYFDDKNWEGGFTAEAIERLKEIGFTHLYDRDNGAFFQRTK